MENDYTDGNPIHPDKNCKMAKAAGKFIFSGKLWREITYLKEMSFLGCWNF